MPFKEIEDLRILKESEEIAGRIWEILVNWDYFLKDTIGKQLIKAADSIGANIVESQGRFHPKDAINFLYMSRGSLKETKFWLRKSMERKLLPKDKYEELVNKIDNLAPQLNAFIKTQQNRNSSKLTNQQTSKLICTK